MDNAAKKGASAVLIYPDIQDYKYLADTALYGHVSLHTEILEHVVKADKLSSQYSFILKPPGIVS